MVSRSPSPTQSLSSRVEEKQQDTSAPFPDGSEEQSTIVREDQSADTTTVEDDWVTGIKLLSITAALCLVCFLMLLDISIIVTAIPRLTSDFHSLPDVGWYGSAYQLASAALQPLTGKFYVNFNQKWTFLSFFAIFELGSLLCGLASSSKMLIIGRAVAGMGTSGIMNGTFTIISGCVPMHRQAALIGLAMGISQLGIVLGPLIGGVLTEYTTWRWCFYINLPIGGFVAALLVFVNIPERIPKATGISVARTVLTKLDLIGFALFASAIIQLLLALQYGGNQFAWNSATVIGLFCGGGATLIIFVAWEYVKGDAAMIPFSMIRRRTVWSSCLVFGFSMSTVFCASYYLPIYFQGVKGVSPTMSGVYLLPSILSQLFGAIASGKLVGKLGYYLPWSLFGAGITAIGNGLVSTFDPHTSAGKWIGYQILLGAGRGIGMQMPILAVQNTLTPPQIPIAMALVMFSQSFGGAMFLSFADTIFTNSMMSLIPQYAPSVDPKAVIAAGATGFRNLISGNDLANVLVAYSKSADRVFYLAVGAAVGSFIFAWGMGWHDIRKKNNVSNV